jgi:hypothetical protein
MDNERLKERNRQEYEEVIITRRGKHEGTEEVGLIFPRQSACGTMILYLSLAQGWHCITNCNKPQVCPLNCSSISCPRAASRQR